MADMPPTNPSAEPMKKTTGKVQPKKETVRINLPPKPTAAPTIKLPTLPPGGPTGASSGMPMAAPATLHRAAPAAQPQRGAAPATVSRPVAPAAAAPTISAFDKILTFAVAIVALAAVGTTVWMILILNAALNQ